MDTADRPVTPLPATVARPDRAFPTLTPQQLSRVAAHGRRRSTTRGEVLVEAGDRDVPFLVVLTGELQALRSTDTAETLIVAHHAGQFSGEANMISGRRAMGRLRVSEPADVIQLEREQLLTLIQTDAELSEILMRAFLLRRLALIQRDLGDVVVVGRLRLALIVPLGFSLIWVACAIRHGSISRFPRPAHPRKRGDDDGRDHRGESSSAYGSAASMRRNQRY